MKKRINIYLKDDIHTKAKVISVLKNMPLSAYFEKAIDKAIKKDKHFLSKLKE